jgi:hypothetical protein
VKLHLLLRVNDTMHLYLECVILRSGMQFRMKERSRSRARAGARHTQLQMSKFGFVIGNKHEKYGLQNVAAAKPAPINVFAAASTGKGAAGVFSTDDDDDAQPTAVNGRKGDISAATFAR